MNIKIKGALLILLLVFAQNILAQKYTTKSRRAIKYYKKALKQYKEYSFYDALTNTEKALKKDSNFVEVYYLQADIYDKMGFYKKKIKPLTKAIELYPDKKIKVYLILGKTELFIGKYKDAQTHILEFEKKNTNRVYDRQVEHYKKQCEFSINAIENPVPFKPVSLGDLVNTKYDDYFPVITADESRLIFTVGLPRQGLTEIKTQNDVEEDFFECVKSDSGTWQKSYNIGPPINTRGNEGAQAISPDGRILFFTSCGDAFGKNAHGFSYGGCDIFYSVKQGNKWNKPRNIGKPVNSNFWESQPSFSSDGKTLYFVSNRPGGYGKIDIWKSVMQENGSWSKPENLGPNINTSSDDQSPFIHPDNKTLYFSSDGHIGMGQSDIFVSKADSMGHWGKAKNLGYPINTHKKEFSLVVNAKGDKAYFAANYSKRERNMDIYTFDLTKENQPQKVTYVTGIVFDSETKKRLSAKLELINLSTDETVVTTFSDNKTGKYLVCIPTGNDYALNVSRPKYLFHSENFSLKNIPDTLKSYKINVPLNKIKRGKKTILKNVFFETDSYELKKESFPELEKLVKFLNQNTTISIEIGGHTDNTGTDSHNLELSKNRAKSVLNYLANKKIDKKRLSYKGYGSKVPISDNKTVEGRALNRRTEMKIKK